MKITDIFAKKERTFSFEFFPPKTPMATLTLGVTVGELLHLKPDFVSVTYGAGGTTHDLTFDIVEHLQNKLALTVMAHYTCVGASREQLTKGLVRLKEIGIKNLMLLRGDPPKGEKEFKTAEGGLSHADELVSLADAAGDFSCGVAGYPEGHLESADLDKDMFYLKKKIDAGGDFVVTQMFFDAQIYFDFVARARKAGITARILPGILPVTDYAQITRFMQLAKTTIPQDIQTVLESLQGDSAAMYKAGVQLCHKMCQKLLDGGAPGLHFYTLNRSNATLDIYKSLKQ